MSGEGDIAGNTPSSSREETACAIVRYKTAKEDGVGVDCQYPCIWMTILEAEISKL